jgi:RNA polymerase sigma-70 factor, ECF subfamily
VSRARAKVRQSAPGARRDRATQRAVVNAWLSAVEHGDLHEILELLSEHAILSADWGDRSDHLEGAAAIGEQAKYSARLAANSVLVRIDGEPGVAAVMRGRVVSLMAFDIIGGRIAGLDVLADMNRLEREGVLSRVLGDRAR